MSKVILAIRRAWRKSWRILDLGYLNPQRTSEVTGRVVWS